MPWTQTVSANFEARHDARDEQDARAVLELLESTHERLANVFAKMPRGVDVVLHSSRSALILATPAIWGLWLTSDKSARRYLAGRCAEHTLHLLAPRLLARRASAPADSHAMLMLTPAALYAQLVALENNPRLRRARRAAWLRWGAGQYLAGQTEFARPAIARRLREARAPRFPPGRHDAPLLGGSVFDLLAFERGAQAAVALGASDPRRPPSALLGEAFGRPLAETEQRWRRHLARLAAPLSSRRASP